VRVVPNRRLEGVRCSILLYTRWKHYQSHRELTNRVLVPGYAFRSSVTADFEVSQTKPKHQHYLSSIAL
jgi:hypothetical protein